jgi:polyferredoxin
MVMFVVLIFFYSLAVVLWVTTGSLFYLINFVLIGTSVGLGMGLWPVLPNGKKRIGRLISQILVGGYMFFGLGCGLIYIAFGHIMPENMQIEGFWYWLFSGAFMGAVIHYFVAKIIGPLIFNRGWCGWACWTAAVLDLLPWRKSSGRVGKKWENTRYIHFAITLSLTIILIFVLRRTLHDNLGVILLSGYDNSGVTIYTRVAQIPEFWWFMSGNIFYFASGIILAGIMRDNRAFCKYLCPIAVFLKLGSRFSLVKIEETAEGCNDCGLCEKNCPMDIRIREYTRKKLRVGSTECIICQTCVSSCPKKVLGLSVKFDLGRFEYLRRRHR